MKVVYESARSETQNRQSPQQSPVVLERSSVPGSRGFHFCWNNQYWSRCSHWSSFSCYNNFLDIPRGIWEVMGSNPVGDFTSFWPFLIMIFTYLTRVNPSVQAGIKEFPGPGQLEIIKAGIYMKAVFWLGIMFFMQIFRLRFKQSRIRSSFHISMFWVVL